MAQSSQTYLGFDIATYPGDYTLAWLWNQGFRVAGFYLNHHRGSEDEGWISNRSGLVSAGWGLAPLYLGWQTVDNRGNRLPPPSDPTGTATADAAEAVALMNKAGFRQGSVVFFDIEDGTVPSGNYDAYLKSWFSQIRAQGFSPAVYCGHYCTQWAKGHGVPAWSVHIPYVNGGPYDPGSLPVALDPGCVGTQYRQNTHLLGLPAAIDLDCFAVPDPSSGTAVEQTAAPHAATHRLARGFPRADVVESERRALAPMLESSAAEAFAGDLDPAYPAPGEISEIADLASATILSNLGAPLAVSEHRLRRAAGAHATLAVDITVADAFLDACMTCMPRVGYGLGAKVPFLGAVPGQDFQKVDCSGFVREAIRRATTPAAAFPDGSVNQHDWIRSQGFQSTTIAAGSNSDNVVRIAFLRPQDSANGIGHVVLIHNGQTLESHGGVGPDARPWLGNDWQAKAYVYVLTPG
jgi:hypothetical protein